MLFKTYLKEVEDAVGLLIAASPESLPDSLSEFCAQANLGESIDSVRDLMRVVASDAAELKKGLAGVKKTLG